MSDLIRPFSSGSQYCDWTASNCDRCKKAAPIDEDSTCDIELALHLAYITDGKITKEIADRMGYISSKYKYCWQCNEVEWTEEWKTEYLQKGSRLNE